VCKVFAKVRFGPVQGWHFHIDRFELKIRARLSLALEASAVSVLLNTAALLGGIYGLNTALAPVAAALEKEECIDDRDADFVY
jgi:hypothetical protein